MFADCCDGMSSLALRVEYRIGYLILGADYLSSLWNLLPFVAFPDALHGMCNKLWDIVQESVGGNVRAHVSGPPEPVHYVDFSLGDFRGGSEMERTEGLSSACNFASAFLL